MLNTIRYTCTVISLTYNTRWAISADNKLIFFLFFSENIELEANLHEIANLIFLKKKRQKKKQNKKKPNNNNKKKKQD